MKTYRLWALTVLLGGALVLSGCGDGASPSNPEAGKEVGQSAVTAEAESRTQPPVDQDAVTILVAAAASLEYSYRDQLIPMFQERHPHIRVEGTYDSSGKLQTQIEEGMDADVFMSAATKQMDALVEKKMVDAESVVRLLENKIVLIVPAHSEGGISSFEEIVEADPVALGDPESVPVGQYAQEALTNLGLYDQLGDKMSLGSNVTEVLNWVAEGSAEAGIVYATDAATTDKVTVVAEAPTDSLAQPVIYPVGVVTASQKKEATQLFVDFLGSKEAQAIFQEWGFTPVH